MKRVLAHKGIDIRSPRDCFREAALNGIISDPKMWFNFIEKRNLTVQTYNEDIVEELMGVLGDFSKSMDEFLGYLKNETSA